MDYVIDGHKMQVECYGDDSATPFLIQKTNPVTGLAWSSFGEMDVWASEFIAKRKEAVGFIEPEPEADLSSLATPIDPEINFADPAEVELVVETISEE